MIYLKLFLCYVQIGLFSIGGGHAALPMVSSIIVENRGWLSLAEFADMVTISIMAPGTVALNTAAFVGFKMGGIVGGIATSFACMFPGFIIIIIYSYLFKKYNNMPAVSGALFGIRPAITGLIASAGLYILFLAIFNTKNISEINKIDIISAMIFVFCIIILRRKKVNPVLMIIASGFLGIIAYGLIATQF